MAWTRVMYESVLEQADSDQQAITQSMERLDLDDGSSLNVFDLGHGDPIIFLPMTAELHFVYAPQIEEFKSDHRVLMFDPRLSTTHHVGIEDRASDAVALMKRLGIEKAHIVGWSDTGSVAYCFAKLWPEKCRSVIFYGLADKYTFPLPLRFVIQLLKSLPIEDLIPSSVVASVLGKYAGGKQLTPAMLAERGAQIPHLSRLFKYSTFPNLFDHKPVAGEIQVPALQICGDDDALVTVDQARRMSKLLPNAPEPVIIPGGEHFLPYIYGSEVNKAMREYYASLT